MIEITIHGRGGQGGVTLAKLIAMAHFLRGKEVQAFGLYAAERSGAPLQAFVRIDDAEITNHNQIVTPDHIIILDRTLISPRILGRLKEDGWVILNTSEPPEEHSDVFAGRKVATIDATRIAVEHGLGTRAVPIVNTTLLGAVAKVFDLPLEDATAALEALRFGGANVEAARTAYKAVACARLKGEVVKPPAGIPAEGIASILDQDTGGIPSLHTGNWATSQPRRRSLTPPCNHGCPAGNDVQGFIAEVGRGHYDAALAALLETTPFPGVCGRVCPAPCVEACNRRLFDEPVNIPELERAAADRGHRPAPTKPWRSEHVAVVGAGPAGLSAAYHLARLGYHTSIIEANDELGGVMRTGIPEYRLPREVLDAEIDHILAHGVETRTGEPLDRAALMNLTYSFNAVVVGTGLQQVRSLNLDTSEGDVVTEGLAFLDGARDGRESAEGLDVVVIGGGNTAIDAARTALRLGACRVRVAYRRTREQMPAIKEEIREALEEGVLIQELVNPVRLRIDDAGPILTCERMMLGELDASGRPQPVPVLSEDSHFDLPCDRVILALGQGPDQSILPEGSDVREGTQLIGLTGGPMFFCGDFANNEGTVSAAIGSGRAAAWHAHRTLTGESLFHESPPIASIDNLQTHVFVPERRREGAVVPAGLRRRSFTEVRKGFSAEPPIVGCDDVVLESQRCFSCGVCNQCDRCLDYCPEGIVVRDGNEYRFDYGYCKGCAICASVCPRGVICMSEL